MTIKPLQDRVVVKMTEAEETTSSVSTDNVTEPTHTDDETYTETTTQEETLSSTAYSSESDYYVNIYGGNGDTHQMKYIYPANNFDGQICDFCSDQYYTSYEYPHISDDLRYIIYYQDEYLISANGYPYFVPISENAIDIINDNTVSSTRAEEDDSSPSLCEYSVSIFIPKNADQSSIKDSYYYIARLENCLNVRLEIVIPICLIFLILTALLLIILFRSAGYVKNKEEAIAKGFHRFPTDILLLIFAGMIFAVVIAADEIADEGTFINILVIPAFALLIINILIAFCETTAVRIKTKTVFSSMITVKLFKRTGSFLKKSWLKIKPEIKSLSANTNLMIKGFTAFFIISVIEVIIIINIFENNFDAEFILLFYVIFKVAESIGLFFILLNLNTLQNGTKSVSEGDLTTKTDNRFLFGAFKTNAEYLNSIQDVINNAVNEKVKSESMKTQLITNVSHDLKTPLTSIINYIELLKKEKTGNSKADEYIDVISRQSLRLKKLTADIVDASKAATGNIELQFEKTCLNVLVSQINGEYSDKLSAADLSLINNCPQNDVYISADGKYMWRIFDNLMNNICKYSLPGSRVYITLTEENDNACLIFRNISKTELNISPDELTERFVRGDSSRNEEGSGLGLSIAKSLTEAMNGTFDISIDGDLFKASLIFKTVC